jgi:hypothetical protein
VDLRATILAVHSKAQTNKIVKWVGHSQARFDELMNLFLNEEYRIIQRAGWPLSFIVEEHPDLIQKHLKKLIDNLSKPKIPEAVIRNSIRILQFVEIPAKYHGKIIDLCINYLRDNNTPAAIKAYSLIILKKFSILYQDIRQEIKTIIEDRWDIESPAFHVQARRFLDLKR